MGYPGMLARLGPLAYAGLAAPAWWLQQYWFRTPAGIRARDAASFRPGDGLNIVGTENAQKRFMKMVQREMRRSPVFHELMLKINEDKAHPVRITLGWNEPKSYIDRFDSKNFAPGHQDIDLADYAQFPIEPPADHPNAITQGELLTHAMAEARAGALGQKVYEKAHGFAITAQNVYRDERGQQGHRINDGTRQENGVFEIEYDNGYSEEWTPRADDRDSIARIVRFGDR